MLAEQCQQPIADGHIGQEPLDGPGEFIEALPRSPESNGFVHENSPAWAGQKDCFVLAWMLG